MSRVTIRDYNTDKKLSNTSLEYSDKDKSNTKINREYFNKSDKSSWESGVLLDFKTGERIDNGVSKRARLRRSKWVYMEV